MLISSVSSLFISNCVFQTKLHIHANFNNLTFDNNIFKCEKFNISGCKIEQLSFRNQEKSYSKKLQSNEFNIKQFEINSSEIETFTMDNISFSNELIVNFDRIKFSFLFNIQNLYVNQITVQNCEFLEQEFDHFKLSIADKVLNKNLKDIHNSFLEFQSICYNFSDISSNQQNQSNSLILKRKNKI